MAGLAARIDRNDALAISVVIPTLNEAERLPRLLAALAWMPLLEVIVADGGSTDDTCALAARGGAQVVRVPQAGRARQLNAGAAVAQGRVLWFLHADACPPEGAVAGIRHALADPGVVGGAFLLRTVSDRGGRGWGPLLRIADVRSRVTRHPYGDQGLFVRRDVFDAVGPYPDLALMEDLALSQHLVRVGRLARVPLEVTVSGRRFENRLLASFAMMQVFPTLYRLGVPTERLAAWYRHER